MTNTPGWASPGSSGSPEPDSGDSPDITSSAARPETGDDTPERTADAPTDAAAGTPGDSAATPPQSTGWSQQQPPAGMWQASSTTDPAATAPPTDTPAPPPAPTAPQRGRTAGGWGRQWAPPKPPEHGGPRWGPSAPQYGVPYPGYTVPTAPQPGVIPLRPLDAGQILSGAFATFRAHWRTAMLLAFGVALLTEGVNAVISRYMVDDSAINKLNHESDPSLSDIWHALSGSAAASGLVLVTSMVGVLVTSGLLTVVVSRAVLGRPVTLGASWRDIRPRLAHVTGLALLLPLALVAILAVLTLPGVLIAWAGAHAGGAALASLGFLAAAVIGLWQWNLWSLAAPALVLEKQGVLPAVKRSMKLVEGSWWRVLGVQLLVMLVTGVASVVIDLPFTFVADAVGNGGGGLFSADAPADWPTVILSAVGGVIASTIALPISASAVSLLYIDQRIRREGLDIELARAAKVPGYEAPAPSDVRS
ncbi:MAG: hypothetical protein HOY69_24695 [Streptomyces sp.]|nr:hypothetical protein [Streptomyces sp.]